MRSGPVKRAKRIDAALDEVFLALSWHRISEGPFEGDQVLPIDVQVPGHAMTSHAAREIDSLGAADQHLLGITAAQGAGATEWAMVDHRHRTSRSADPARGHLSRGSGTNYDEIIGIHPSPRNRMTQR